METAWATALTYPTVVPAVMLRVAHAGQAVPTVAEPRLYVPEVRFNTLEAPGVITKPPSLNTLFAVISPIVSVVIVEAANNVTPAALLDFKTLYVYPATV